MKGHYMHAIRSTIAAFIALIISALSYSVMLADDYNIPVIINGETYTVTVSVEDNAVVTATSIVSSVVVGPIVDVTPKQEFIGMWADMMDINPDDYLGEENEFSGYKFYNIDFDENFDPPSFNFIPYVGLSSDTGAFLRILLSAHAMGVMGGDFKVSILADDEPFSMSYKSYDMISDVWSGGNVRYEVDSLTIDSDVEMLKAIALADTVKIRFDSSRNANGYIQVELTPEQIAFVKRTLVIYAKLGGDLGDDEPSGSTDTPLALEETDNLDIHYEANLPEHSDLVSLTTEYSREKGIYHMIVIKTPGYRVGNSSVSGGNATIQTKYYDSDDSLLGEGSNLIVFANSQDLDTREMALKTGCAWDECIGLKPESIAYYVITYNAETIPWK